MLSIFHRYLHAVEKRHPAYKKQFQPFCIFAAPGESYTSWRTHFDYTPSGLTHSVLHGIKHFRNFVVLNGSDPSGFDNGHCTVALDESGFLPGKASAASLPASGPIPDLSEHCWRFGFISYDYKNRIELLSSAHADYLQFPEHFFFKPALVLSLKEQTRDILENRSGIKRGQIDALFRQEPTQYITGETAAAFHLKSRLSRREYIERVKQIKSAILKGEIYEMNFCLEFFAEDIEIDPFSVYEKLNRISAAPFSAFCRFGDKFVLSSSPERFLKKTGNRLISQPIKGTGKRSENPLEDARFRNELRENEKELAENVMIVDLVRNDLSRIAQRGSVNVDELCGIYSFAQVHQMISTVSCTLKPGVSFAEILKAVFPMGSMTGAPKIRAMQLIEKFETSKRGLYSGALGYIKADGDFDFSVVIRSILYDASMRYLSFMVGSAITDKSDPEQEYEECLLKAKGMMEALGATLKDS